MKINFRFSQLNVYNRITITHQQSPNNAKDFILKIYRNGELLEEETDDKSRNFYNVSICTGSPFYDFAKGYKKVFG